ncbi:MAG: hypothetical protein ABI619_09795, partial [Betaproteobacteria bacterium]
MLSVAALVGVNGHRFFSLGGRPSPAQIELLRSAMHRMPADSTIELRFDNDSGGRDIAAYVTSELAPDATAIRSIDFVPPPDRDTDWNDQLREMQSAHPSKLADVLRRNALG